jgi:hypothetical protein
VGTTDGEGKYNLGPFPYDVCFGAGGGTTDGEGKYNLGPFPYDVCFRSRGWEPQTARANTTSDPSLVISALGAGGGNHRRRGQIQPWALPLWCLL